MVQDVPNATRPVAGVSPVAGAVAFTSGFMGAAVSRALSPCFFFGRPARLVDETRFTARDVIFFTPRFHVRSHRRAGDGLGEPLNRPCRRWPLFLRRWRRSAPGDARFHSRAPATLRAAAWAA